MMWPAVCVLLVVLLVRCGGELRNVSLNPTSSAYSSIATITHDTSERQLIIDMQKRRRCERPFFQIRLSGTALYLLDLTKHEYEPLVRESSGSFISPRKSTYYYTYPPIQDAGLYFLEIVLVYCTDFNPSNFENICVEDHADGRSIVNAPYSVQLAATNVAAGKVSPSPHWVLSNKQDPQHTLALLPTRYQPLHCGAETNVCERIQDPKTLWQYQLYDWVNKPDWREPFTKLSPTRTNVCFVGASHARELTAHANALNTSSVRLYFTHIDARFPSEFNVNEITRYGCDYAILGFGQWPVSWQAHVVCNAECYRASMRNLIIQASKLAATGTVKLFIRSVNYNGFGTFVTSCPPFDHRTPPVIQMMNQILQQLTAELSVPYIDLNHIIGPMWDSALDYSHPKGKVFTAEAEWVLHSIFSTTYAAQQSGTGAASTATVPKVPDRLIRFTDESTVYLVRDGVARAFPNAQTFMKMGFEFGDVSVQLASTRGTYTFSSDLPSL